MRSTFPPALLGLALAIFLCSPLRAQGTAAPTDPTDRSDPTDPSASLDSISPDRPDFTEGTSIVPLGYVQVEGGTTFSKVEEEEGQSLGEVLVRIPFSERAEARLGVGSYSWSRGGGARSEGYEDPLVGMKVRLTETGDQLPPGHPELSVLLLTSVPVGSRDLTADAWQPTVKLAMGWDLTDRFSLSSNLNYSWLRDGDADDRFGQAAVSLSAGLSVTDRLGAYLEAFGFSEEQVDGPSTKYINGGFSYLVTNDLKVDIRAGAGLNDASPDWFVGVGGGVRF
jgi:hypothetical protein